ncbi:MAG: GAF domain-containing protein [Gemmatimonadaceae bacterium]
MYRRENDPKRDSVSEVMARYSRRMDFTREEVAEILRAALAETKEVFVSSKVSIDDLKLRRLQSDAMKQIGATNPTPAVAAHAPAAVPVEATAPTADSVAALLQLREELLAELERVAQPESGEDLNRVLLMMIEGVFRGGPFDRVVFCMSTPDRAGVKARYGLGTGVEGLLERFTFELTPREGPVAVAMLRRQSIYVPVERDFTAQELRFAQSLGSSSFGVFPVVVGARLVGCVYCDRPWNSRPPDRATLQFVRALCDSAARGMAARQAVSTPRQSITGAHQVLRATPAYSATFKGGVVLRLLRGEMVDVVSRELNVDSATLERWKTEFLASAMAGMKSG